MKNFKRLRASQNLRDLVNETRIHLDDFIYPLFVTFGNGVKNEIKSMPEVYQFSIDNLVEECKQLQDLGLKNILLFGLPEHKDPIGSSALDHNHIVARAIEALHNSGTTLTISADLCFCEYTDHGHCGILDSKSHIDNAATLENLGKQALILADAGADIIAPSAMLDDQVAHLRAVLDSHHFDDKIIMSYSTKFSSSYYGPFRDAAASAPSFGDRASYQESYANRFEAIRESLEDERQGADILMVKPALAYLDIVRDIRERTLLPLAIYNVSGEYSMLKFAGLNGLVNYEKILLETMTSFKRSGADIIISYHAKELATMLKTSTTSANFGA